MKIVKLLLMPLNILLMILLFIWVMLIMIYDCAVLTAIVNGAASNLGPYKVGKYIMGLSYSIFSILYSFFVVIQFVFRSSIRNAKNLVVALCSVFLMAFGLLMGPQIWMHIADDPDASLTIKDIALGGIPIIGSLVLLYFSLKKGPVQFSQLKPAEK